MLVAAHGGTITISLWSGQNGLVVDEGPRAAAGVVVLFRAGDAAGELLPRRPWAISVASREGPLLPAGFAIRLPDHDLAGGRWDRRGVPRLPAWADAGDGRNRSKFCLDRSQYADAGWFEPLCPPVERALPVSLGPGVAVRVPAYDRILRPPVALGARCRRMGDAITSRLRTRWYATQPGRAARPVRAERIYRAVLATGGEWRPFCRHGLPSAGIPGALPAVVRDRRREWAADIVVSD
jgi:hypothetical protein